MAKRDASAALSGSGERDQSPISRLELAFVTILVALPPIVWVGSMLGAL